MMRQKRCIVQLIHPNMLWLSRSADRAFPKVMSYLIPGYFVNGRSISGGLVYDGLIPSRLICDGFIRNSRPK